MWSVWGRVSLQSCRECVGLILGEERGLMPTQHIAKGVRCIIIRAVLLLDTSRPVCALPGSCADMLWIERSSCI